MIALCLKGDHAAWECLVHRYKRLVYHFPNDTSLSREDGEEVFQETFLALYKNLEKLSEVDDLGNWVATVAQRITWRWLHRSRRGATEELSEGYEVEDPGQIPEHRVALKVCQSKVRFALTLLDKRCRDLLHLLFYKYESANYDEIARDTGMSRGSIGPIRRRCLTKFRAKLGELGINEKNVSNWQD